MKGSLCSFGLSVYGRFQMVILQLRVSTLCIDGLVRLSAVVAFYQFSPVDHFSYMSAIFPMTIRLGSVLLYSLTVL